MRIWRSPYSAFGKALRVPDDLRDETITAVDAYDAGTLGEIKDSGFNAIWVHGLLQNMVRTEVFPELGRNSARHLRNMRKLIERAERFGIKVFLYMQPPRSIDVTDRFWKRHPEVGGQESDFITDDGFAVRTRSLCTSVRKVRRFLKEASGRLAAGLPNLGGVILITASEYPSHCWGRCGAMTDDAGCITYSKPTCGRCAKRDPSEIVAEIINLVRDGIRNQSSEQRIIAWNWSWSSYEKAPYPGIISHLAHDIVLMADFERGGGKAILGMRRCIDEYSLSYVGPSGQFMKTVKAARNSGIAVLAKLQIGTTHELATVPNLPLIGHLYEKAKAMRKGGVSSFMGCWGFGSMTTANTEAFNRFILSGVFPGRKTALMEFAGDYFPNCRSDLVASAWEQFAEAMKSYPFSLPFLYSGPVNYTLAYPLRPKSLSGRPMGRSWQMDRRGDDLRPSLEPYGLDDVIRGLGGVAGNWMKGVKLLERGLQNSDGEITRKELDNARVCYHVFRSAWNTYRVYRLRLEWRESKMDAFRRIAANELDNLEAVLPLVRRDKRFGYHSEAHGYMFNAASIRRKVRELKTLW